jgi:hypothetical protein
MNTHATIKEPVSKQRIDKHNNRGIVGNDVFCGGSHEEIKQSRFELCEDD